MTPPILFGIASLTPLDDRGMPALERPNETAPLDAGRLGNSLQVLFTQ